MRGERLQTFVDEVLGQALNFLALTRTAQANAEIVAFEAVVLFVAVAAGHAADLAIFVQLRKAARTTCKADNAKR